MLYEQTHTYCYTWRKVDVFIKVYRLISQTVNFADSNIDFMILLHYIWSEWDTISWPMNSFFSIIIFSVLAFTTRFLSAICGYPHLKQLFRRHKKQFSDLFLELDNKLMIEICSNTCDTHLLLVFFDWNRAKNHSIYAVKHTDFIVFFPIVIIVYLFLWKTFKTFDMIWVFA
jgi:hypothetical protein